MCISWLHTTYGATSKHGPTGPLNTRPRLLCEPIGGISPQIDDTFQPISFNKVVAYATCIVAHWVVQLVSAIWAHISSALRLWSISAAIHRISRRVITETFFHVLKALAAESAARVAASTLADWASKTSFCWEAEWTGKVDAGDEVVAWPSIQSETTCIFFSSENWRNDIL